MRMLEHVDKEDQEFFRRIILSMISSGAIRMPEIDFASGTPDETIFKLKDVFRRVFLLTNSALIEMDKEMAEIQEMASGTSTEQ